jgi:hypothetical protein
MHDMIGDLAVCGIIYCLALVIALWGWISSRRPHKPGITNEAIEKALKESKHPLPCKVIKGVIKDTGLPIDGQTLFLGLWKWDNSESYHLYTWDNSADEAVMKTMHQEDQLYGRMPLRRFRRIWKAGKWEPDGDYCIDLDKVDVIEVISEGDEEL